MKFKRGIYRDKDGKLFELIDVGQTSDGSVDLVIYREVYGNQRYFVCQEDDFDLKWIRER